MYCIDDSRNISSMKLDSLLSYFGSLNILNLFFYFKLVKYVSFSNTVPTVFSYNFYFFKKTVVPTVKKNT